MRIARVSGFAGVLALLALGALARIRQGADAPTPAPPVPPARLTLARVPDRVGAEVELFKSDFGRVVVRAADAPLQLHRHAHATWLALGEADATWSERGRLVRARLSPGELLYTPAYASYCFAHAAGGAPALLVGFVAAPEDDAALVDPADARVRDAADAVRIAPAGPRAWMLDKLARVEVTGTETIGPFRRDAALYVVAGEGAARGGGGAAIGPRQLWTVPAGVTVEVTAASPLTLLVFDPARTSVSPILKEDTKRYSQDDEELVIRDFFRDRRGGVFVDVGAGHPQRDSTTLYLEERLGWSGVAVDALAEYADGYRLHRPRTTFVNALVTDRARGPQAFYRADAYPELSSVSRQLAEAQSRQLTDGGVVSERTVATSTLDAVLDRLGVRSFDFLSMDIEEHEPAALAGFSIERFRPAFVCVEAHPAVRDALWRYFHRHGYVRQDQYLAWDSANWYFARQ